MSAELEREFDALMARSGITVPAERRAGALAGYVALRRMAALVHAPRPAELEPSYTHDPTGILGNEPASS